MDPILKFTFKYSFEGSKKQQQNFQKYHYEN